MSESLSQGSGLSLQMIRQDFGAGLFDVCVSSWREGVKLARLRPVPVCRPILLRGRQLDCTCRESGCNPTLMGCYAALVMIASFESVPGPNASLRQQSPSFSECLAAGILPVSSPGSRFLLFDTGQRVCLLHRGTGDYGAHFAGN